ncbi:MAG: hypothetical protein H6Q38_2612, partial [Chloroflexi bacterium]|nr:hypothetical protein [Chloroflexota bacterium]
FEGPGLIDSLDPLALQDDQPQVKHQDSQDDDN